jgi:phosphate transport system substrate-binding protein
MKTMRWIAVGLALVGVILVGSGCGRQQAAGPVVLNGAGATFPYPLYSKWFDVYRKETGVQVNYQSIGSGGGIQQLKAGTVDFAASDAPLSDAEEKEMPHPVAHIPTVAGAVVMAYNLPKMSKPLRLSGETLAAIYLGGITRWNDRRLAALNPDADLPNLPIAVAHRSDGSGTTYIFTHYLAAVSKAWADKVGAGKSVGWPVGLGGKGNEGVTGLVKQTQGGIGYLELAYADQNKLVYALVRNAHGTFIEPTLKSTTAAARGGGAEMARDVRTSIVNSPEPDAYPIAGFTYLLIYREEPESPKRQALVKFLGWAIDKGQTYAPPLLYAPLPPEVVAVNQVTIGALEPRAPEMPEE